MFFTPHRANYFLQNYKGMLTPGFGPSGRSQKRVSSIFNVGRGKLSFKIHNADVQLTCAHTAQVALYNRPIMQLE